ncbi:inositol 2-dehydrogenase [Alkalihalobacillus sp. MEB130]|uniref:inositol 2-dehydrogenase n=1 Tax=Alkalihalobacillus sp. MEB130 TaxID=2976704 RepID=UPI0028DD8948|nr:inositol 2-dehydrogenase [Alkalihalobacillus sp. MEB130]MDT8858938.1 inositol 2-dehydrogenase [Alkalihalobacillus sp. MEB130]
MSSLRVGIIGAGRIGQLHAKNILQSSSVELRAISDVFLDGVKGSSLEKEVAYLTTDYKDLIKDPEIDAVLICSPTDTHVDIIVEAAAAGKHIFCEKPISFSIDETKRALQAVAKANVKFQVGFNRRFDKNFRKVSDTVRAGQIGDPHIIRVTSRDPEAPPASYIQRSGGMFMDMTIHDFDMIRYLSNKNVVEVYVKAANLVDPVIGECGDVDTAIITLTFEDGSLAVIDNSRKAVYGYDQRVEVFGNNGAVSANNERLSSVEISTDQSVLLDKPKNFFLDRYEDAYVDELNSFVEAILGNKEVECTGEDGFQAEILAHAARKSWEEKRAVVVSELVEEVVG